MTLVFLESPSVPPFKNKGPTRLVYTQPVGLKPRIPNFIGGRAFRSEKGQEHWRGVFLPGTRADLEDREGTQPQGRRPVGLGHQGTPGAPAALGCSARGEKGQGAHFSSSLQEKLPSVWWGWELAACGSPGVHVV